MKRVLGLDLGTTSIGWALVNEAENENEVSEIVKLGVRVNPLTVDEKIDFEKGRPLTTNTKRTLKRGARRNLQRFKLRRTNLIEILKINGFIDENTPLTEIGKNTTYQSLSLRSRAAKEKISLEDLAKVFLAINKKRGYKSSRKVSNDDDGLAIDGMSVAKKLYENNLTPGAYILTLLKEKRKYLPDFYRSDLEQEFKSIWEYQKQFYLEILSDTLFSDLQGKNKSQTWAICQKPFSIEGIKQKGTASDKRLERYQWRVEALTKKLSLEYLAIVFQDINNDLNKSSGYLGAISDRSKELYFKKETIGENLYRQILKNPHTSLKNQVFYRQDYLDEFEEIWEVQKKYHSVLTNDLKEKIRDVVIFYQRKLKSQKSLISLCQFESWEQKYIEKETGRHKVRLVGRKVIPKSSPLFQEFKIWQNLNHLEYTNQEEKQSIVFKELDEDIKEELFEELNIRGDLNPNFLLKIISKYIKIRKLSEWKCNFDKIEGNRTNEKLYNIFQVIAENEGYGFDWTKKTALEIKEELKGVFPELGIDASIVSFDSDKSSYDNQPHYTLWHLLYSVEEDDKISEEDKLVYGNSSVSLKKKLHLKYGIAPQYASLLVNITLQPDYGNLSAKAIRNILPFLKSGNTYSEACALAKYNHSNSLTSEELANRELSTKLELLKKNSLRNPVVEKILNQMVNVVNEIIDVYGKPDEVRIELARELKKSAKERADMTKGIADATKRNDDIKKLITREYRVPNPTKNDVIRYRLWKELENVGYKDVFTNIQIKAEDLFSSKIDIEHIIPKALLFDDSFSNKTLAFRRVNLKKANRTAYDFISQDFQEDLEPFIERVEGLYKDGKISKGKRNKLLMAQSKLPDGFIERDLRNTQYISKKAKQMLFKVFRSVVSTSGNITDKLRSDWDLINVMKELSLPKYKALGLTETIKRWDSGQEKEKEIEVIKDWTKRNDHRHHAMDALTVAFTTHSHIHYLNNLNARRDFKHKKHTNINTIENSLTKKNKRGKRVFKSPLLHFRTVAKEHMESILISYKNKNKVVTKNINRTKGESNFNTKVQLTPRGKLHLETVYGKIKQAQLKPIKLNKRFTLKQAQLIINKSQRELIISHLGNYQNKGELAFDTKVLKNQPIIYKEEQLKEVLCFEEIYTIRKQITPELKIDKVIDLKIKELLKNRLEVYNNKPKEAFSNLDKNPIWLNKAKGISIKRVTIKGIKIATVLHNAKNHLGIEIVDEKGLVKEVDFVELGNNHHIAIYENPEKEELKEHVVPFIDAVERRLQGQEVVNLINEDGWPLLFTLKQNEMFVFPNDDFNPLEIDLLDPLNYKEISKNLFRVQSISSRYYIFRHHLETKVANGDTFKNFKNLSGVTYRFYQSEKYLKGAIKVRINHIGQIVQVGEY